MSEPPRHAMPTFRFVHTADLHLDSPLRSLALRDASLAERVGSATRGALERIVALCLAERVDALLIAGDLFDGDQRSMKTAAFLRAQMRLLDDAGIRVFAIRGNHDAAAPVTGALSLPPNVHVFSGQGGVVEHRGVALQGVSFAERAAPQSLLPKYRPPREGMPNVALLHTSLAGAEGHDTYAPCSVADLMAHGADYWALGHIHARTVHATEPWIVMPGMPQGRAIDEAGPKSATLVTIGEAGIEAVPHPTATLEFAHVSLPLDGVEDWDRALRLALDALQTAGAAATAPYAAVRLRLEGESSLAWRLRRDAAVFEEELRTELTAAGGEIHLERLVLALGGQGAAAQAGGGAGVGPVAELEALMSEVAGDAGFRHEADEHLERMVQALPPEIRDRFGADAADRASALEALLKEGGLTVMAALRAVDAD